MPGSSKTEAHLCPSRLSAGPFVDSRTTAPAGRYQPGYGSGPRRQWLRSALTSCFLFIAERPLIPTFLACFSRSCLLQSQYDPPLPPLEAVARRELAADALAIRSAFSFSRPSSAATGMSFRKHSGLRRVACVRDWSG